jgi:type 1 glutamine amidotransferase
MKIVPGEKIRVLIVDGQNNHGVWPKTTYMMKNYLEGTGRFEVAVNRTHYTYQGPHTDPSLDGKRDQLIDLFPISGTENTEAVETPRHDPSFLPDFSKYDVIISNFGWQTAPWPQAAKDRFEQYVANGGGLVIIHAANNAFPDWVAYNKMIGLGGWGDRTEKDGPYVYLNKEGQYVRDMSPGPAGSHGYQSEFVITLRDKDHPITRGMPLTWMHGKDELYDRLRGPAENMHILATAYSDVEGNASFFSPLKGTGRHEPVMMVIHHGSGRVFHTVLGHTDYSFESVGFIESIVRGTEWAATGDVQSTKIPKDFPTSTKASYRKFKK